jgi:D-3-phosphoglycerate dehydrogenase
VKLLITARSFRAHAGEHKRILQEAECECVESTLDRPLAADEMVPLVADIDGVIVGLDAISARVIAAAPRLRVISKYGVGVDNIDLAAATRAGVVVAYAPSTNHVSVAELTLGLMLSLARCIPRHAASAKQGKWKRIIGVELAGKTLGIIGMGQVGEAVARRARAFEMRIVYFDPRRRPDLEAEGWVVYSGLDAVLATCDIVSLHCPHVPGSPPLIGAEQLRTMKSGAFLVNTARGELVDEGALARALGEVWISGAASDVFVREPPDGSPLPALENFIATPHMGANTVEAVQRMAVMAARNAVLVLQGQRPLAVANPEVYEAKRGANEHDGT